MIQNSRFQKGADRNVNRVCKDKKQTSCREVAAVSGSRGSRVQMEGQADRWTMGQTGGQENGLTNPKWAASVVTTKSS